MLEYICCNQYLATVLKQIPFNMNVIANIWRILDVLKLSTEFKESFYQDEMPLSKKLSHRMDQWQFRNGKMLSFFSVLSKWIYVCLKFQALYCINWNSKFVEHSVLHFKLLKFGIWIHIFLETVISYVTFWLYLTLHVTGSCFKKFYLFLL